MPPRSYRRRTMARHCSAGNACRSTTAGISPAASAANGLATRASTSPGVPSIGVHVIVVLAFRAILLHADRIPAADPAGPEYLRINADIRLVVLNSRAQNADILGEIPLGEGRHHTSGTGPGDPQAHLLPDG